MIGAVGTLLGQQGINVSSMHVGVDDGGVALALWNVSTELEPSVLADVRAVPRIESARVIRL